MADRFGRPRFVGIAGGSGAGKTTITASVMDTLGEGAALLQLDWYYRDQSDVPLERRAGVNYDHPDALDGTLLAAHLSILREGQTIHAPQYDFSAHTRAPDTVLIRPRPVIVIEGIHSLADDTLSKYIDLTVFVDTPADIRFIRRLRRDLAARGRTVESVITQYLEHVRPMHEAFVEPGRLCADLVLSGEADVSVSVARILTCLGLEA